MDIVVKYREQIEQAKLTMNKSLTEAANALQDAFVVYNDATEKAIEDFKVAQVDANGELEAEMTKLGMIPNGKVYTRLPTADYVDMKPVPVTLEDVINAPP